MLYEAENLVFSYPGSGRRVLDGVSLSVGEGEIVSILGKNGAGKSTLLDCMLGLHKAQSGRLTLAGKDISHMSEREIASIIGYVPQTHTPSFAFSVLDFVMMGCAPRIGLFSKPGKRERDDTLAALRQFGIEDLKDRPYTQISGGERQKAMIARAIVSGPRIVFFDEPTAHLDYGSQAGVLRMIKSLAKNGFSVVMTTHNPDHALLLGGKAVLMKSGGKLTYGDVSGIVTRENLSDILGADMHLVYIESLGRNVCTYANL